MKDAVATMGAVLPDDAGGRDAVHVAVISAVAGHKLSPGEHVGFREAPGLHEGTAGIGVAPIGIVDPFIDGDVRLGERFWLYLYPRTITGLTHRWTHPAFSDDAGTAYNTPSQKLAAEQWLRSHIEPFDDYDTLLAVINKMADGANSYYPDKDNDYHGYGWGDGYLTVYGGDAGGEIPDEFWIMAEIVLGRPIKGPRPTYFSCSC